MLHECLARSLLDHLGLPQCGQRGAGFPPSRTHMNPQAAHTSLSPMPTACAPVVAPMPLPAIAARESIPSSYSPLFRPIIPSLLVGCLYQLWAGYKAMWKIMVSKVNTVRRDRTASASVADIVPKDRVSR